MADRTKFEYSNELKERLDKKQELLDSLQALQDSKDYELAHITADELLLAYIGDKEITEAFNNITKHYA